ncbi:hypothetical protein RclHR1_04170004 [Rhizophagus clarus]|uniref:Uncharacterized protein n=1 Tax=Rhizophagus clarus TaxID=94130 RepID=A0A2Z6SA78_9GLOM|nr:hypothetical protein RclHR1_04170004 [Rhizophagus clarus]
MPANTAEQGLSLKKEFSGEFVRFNDKITLANVYDTYTAQNLKHVYRQSDDKFIIEFFTESDLFNTCSKMVHFNDYHITGSSRNYNVYWPDRNKRLNKLSSTRFPSLEKVVNITQLPDTHCLNIQQEEHITFKNLNHV